VVDAVPIKILEESIEQIDQHTVRLNWTTGYEINNYGFSIQKRNADEEWQECGFVKGAGDTQGISEYEYIDKSCFDLTYYKISQIDNDGQKTDGKIMAVQCGIDKKISVYPVPAKDYVILDILPDNTTVYEVIITGIHGNKKIITQISPDDTRRIDIKSLPSGVYYMILKPLSGTGVQKTIKIVKE